MFESDQHEFDEEYEGYRHPAPPSPPQAVPAPTQPAATASAQTQPTPAATGATAVAEHPAVKEPQEEPQQVAEEEHEEYSYEEGPENGEYHDPAENKAKPPAKKKPNLLLIAGFGALVVSAIVAFTLLRPKDNTPAPGDLGPGIVAADGLRGHLDTRWEGNASTGRLVYQLRIEPMEDRWQAGFSHAILNSPMPMSLNVRLLDSTGFALCGKEIDFHFDPQSEGVQITVPPVGQNDKKMSAAERAAAMTAARQSEIARMQAEEVARERGKDVFQNQITNDGQVSAANVQGTLPCSPDQYRRVDYWDFNTNFPTLEQQAFLLDPKAALLAKKELEPPAHPGKRTLSRLPQEGFVIQGDDRVTGYDSASGNLMAEGKTFHIDKRYGQAAALAWASEYSLIHYRCDQQGNCALSAAGEAAILHARLVE